MIFVYSTNEKVYRFRQRMKLHEYQAKELFQKAGIPVPPGRMATELKDAQIIAKEIGFPCVLKSQVLVGGRGKAGGIKLVKTPQDFDKTFQELKKLTIKGYPVEKIMVAGAIDIKKEFYTAITVDNVKSDAVLIASSEGGIDIEETAKKSPEKIKKFYLNGKKDLDPARWPAFIKSVFSDSAQQQKATRILRLLVDVFFKNDCSLAEINPLIVDGKGDLVALDAKIILDDNGLIKHPELQALRDLKYEDADEIEAKDKGLSFVKLDGNIGCVVNGAGLAMATTDVIKFLGGNPANFLDVGGSSNPEKVTHALNIILRNKDVKVILINIFGGITRCDDIAKGIIEVKNKMDIPVPLVIRLTGTNEKEALALLSGLKMNIYSSMREAVKKAVELAKK